MSISVVGTPQAGSIANGAGVTLTFDVAPITGDVCFTFSGHFTRSGTQALPTTSGYTALYDSTTVSGLHAACAYKVFGATPDTDVTFPGTANAADATGAVAIVLRGVDAAVLGATPVFTPGSGSPPNPGSITTTTPNSWVIVFSASLVFDTTVGTIAGYSNIVSSSTSDSTSMAIAVATKATTTAGVQDPAAWSTWNNGAWKTGTIEVLEFAGVAPTVIEADGSSGGTSVVAGTGSSTARAVLDSDGTSIVVGNSSAIASSVFSSAGTSTANAITPNTVEATFLSIGSSTAAAATRATKRSTFSTAGRGSVIGFTPQVNLCPATIDEDHRLINSVSYLIDSYCVEVNASAAGTSTVNAASRVIKTASFSAAGAGAVNGQGRAILTTAFSSAGASTVSANSQALIPSSFSSNGYATVVGEIQNIGGGTVVVAVDFNSSGIGACSAISTSILTMLASASGAAIVSGVTGTLSSSVALSDGLAIVNGTGGVASAIAERDFSSAGVAVVSGITMSIMRSTFSSNGTAVVNGNSGTLTKSVFNSSGIATVFGHGNDASSSSSATGGSLYVVNIRRRRRARGTVNA